MTQAPTPPGSTRSGERPGVQKFTRHIRQPKPHWWDFLRALPTQARSPLRDALNPRLTLPRRRAARHHARRELDRFVAQAREYSDSVDAMLDRRGMEYVDPSDPVQAAAFVDAITPSGINALNKRQRVAAAIAYARMALEWLDVELGEEQRHGD